MKIKYFFGLAVIAAMTASCSSNEDLGTAGPGTGTNEAGVGYATFTIDLPTTSGTRATTNDQFAGGTDSEYAVNDATLLIFKKTKTSKNENDYTFVETVSLGSLEPWKKTDDNGITTEATITAELNNVTVDKGNDGKGSDYYALVILNNKDKDNKDKVSMPVSTPSTPSTTDTYGTWNAAATVKNLIDYEKGFYMANAPEFTTNDVEPTTLVQIKGIYRTKEEAHNNPGTTVYVERGLAKVTVGTNSTSKIDYFAEAGANATGTNYKSDKVQITNWVLDVTNRKSFPVHVTSGLKGGITPTDPTDQKVPAYADIWKNEAAATGTIPATSRFVSHAAAFKRVYWGIDPNYSKDLKDKDACGKEFTLVKADGSDAAWTTSTEPLYCLENTFDINHMKQGQTTRVIFKAKYKPNGFTEGATFYMVGKNTAIWNEKNLKDEITAAVTKVVTSATTTNTTVDLANTENNITKAGNHLLALSNIKVTGVTLQQTDIDAINAKLGLKEGEGISTYQDAEAYYIARIKHFGDDLTPWNAGNENYGGKNLEWLGRYGVLRNNWYDLTVNSISGPGYPNVPEVKPDTPDDENTKYISVSVKILDWAKRSQSVDL